MKRIFFMIATMLISTVAFCQNISGVIIDDEVGNPVAYAYAHLTSFKDSIPFALTVSDTTGFFFFNNTKITDSIILTVQHLGYFNYLQIVKNEDDFPLHIRLKPSITELDAVTVTSVAPLFKMKGETLNIQVEGSVLSEVGTFLQMLKYVPFVNSNNSGIQILGKEKTIFYINNQQETNINKVNEISTKEIKNVEVILSPGAEYDASSDVVIKIFLKSKQGDGLSGSFEKLLALGDYLSEVVGCNLNYRKNKTDIFGTIRIQDGRTTESEQTDTEIRDATLGTYQFVSKAKTKNIRLDLYLSAGMNTVINENSSFGAKFEFLNTPKDKQAASRKYEQYVNSVFYTDYQMNNKYTGSCDESYYGSAYYNGLWWKKLSVHSNLDIEKSYNRRKMEFNQINADKDNQYIQSGVISDYNLYSSKINFKYPVYNGSITFGNEFVFTDYFRQYTSNYVDFYIEGMKNLSKQQLFVSFLSIQYPIKNFVLQSGLRYEHVKYDYFIDEKKEIDVSQIEGTFFPSFSMTFSKNNVNMSLTYRKSISRPAYSQFRATTEYSSPYEYMSGNLHLQPTMKDEIGVSFAYKKLFFIGGYSYNKNLIVFLAKQYDNKPSIVRSANNLPKYETLFMQTSWSAVIKKWNCFVDFGVKFPLSKLEIFEKIYDFRKPKYYLSFNNIFSLPHKLNLYFHASFYSSGHENINYYKPSSNIYVGFTKEIFIKNLTASVWLTDIFKTNTKNYIYDISNIRRNINIYNGERMLMFQLNYIFNNTESRYQSSRSGIEEKQRL